jgi:hypothetical protein
MSEILFDATDPDVTSARQTEELRLIEQGGQLIEKQEAEVEEKYRRSELEAQEHSQYAGKFKSAEDLEKAYLELQKKLGQKETDDSSSTEENESDESEDATQLMKTESPGKQTGQLPKGVHQKSTTLMIINLSLKQLKSSRRCLPRNSLKLTSNCKRTILLLNPNHYLMMLLRVL